MPKTAGFGRKRCGFWQLAGERDGELEGEVDAGALLGVGPEVGAEGW